ncbi:MAG: methylcobamide--CoM methyltransferase [Chloroflexi bacterium]|nr:methylcobamide--CoM methyltransferase [Chloroflexota bacterium]
MITTVVGSYPKIPPSGPGVPSLRNSIHLFDEGKISLAQLQQVQDQNTLDVINEQVRAGIDLVTDGQVRWDDAQTYVAGRIEGFTLSGLVRWFDTNTYYRQPVCQGRLAWKGPASVRDYKFAAEHSPRPVKAVITGPYTLARLSMNSHYKSFRSFALELAQVLNQEAKALQQAGATFIQFDEPAIVRNKGDFRLFREAMTLLGTGLTVKTALYTYFGDIAGMYPEFLELPFNVFGLDFVMGHAHWNLLRDFPSDRELGLGIMDARNTRMETVEEIVQAVQRISRVVPPSRLYLNPSCGLEFLPRSSAYQKLTRMVEGSRTAQEVLV